MVDVKKEAHTDRQSLLGEEDVLAPRQARAHARHRVRVRTRIPIPHPRGVGVGADEDGAAEPDENLRADAREGVDE